MAPRDDRHGYDQFDEEDSPTYGGDRWAEGGFGDDEEPEAGTERSEDSERSEQSEEDGSDEDRSDTAAADEAAETPEKDAQEAVIAAVLDEIRGGDTPDVVPAQSTVTGYAEFLAVDAALDRRWPESVMEPSLERMQTLCDALGEPQRGYPVVHLTGTNGKTSTSRMIDALLTEVGLRTGRYTSPHLQRATERINLDNRPVTPEHYVATYREVEPVVELVDAKRGDAPALSKFEVLTAMAFASFSDAPVEAAVIEVGLGGRWDATNVADADVAVILPIGVDHAEYLGNDVLDIAREKAGIIKEGSVAVLAAQDKEVAEVLIERCAEVGAQVAREGAEFGVRERELAVGGQRLELQGLSGRYDEIFLPLHGEHQASNAAVALAAAEALVGAGTAQPLDPEAVRAAFASVRSPGRLEPVQGGPDTPTVLLDAAHNPAGATALATALTGEFRFTRLVGVLAVLQGKDARGILEGLEPVLHEVVVTTNSSPRAMDADELGALAAEVFGSDRVSVEPSLQAAVEQAGEIAEEAGGSGVGVVVTGSVVTAGEVRSLFGREPE
ncbi:Dihydrofolate synthase, Folylpolyglutamate synthase [Pseudonocardia sp. Ae168_Ps1]|nr:Dihydrofolate synthase Folylpolyglutamate synthase [Pseudonocardia sp. Ae150A_Ps1]OLL79277.1 Dihydrofolate synthase, Folylpolyglutamate synthase [Pseudonocardia sp. Ae168_Ps1]OLL86585.1 Dihydrofolate synthase, Folylpolyglutamate synthase [Pseudonocardia sp. Ae263_Ps1]OLL93367.1 Dihydrofolate synthase, Folylpolyglutamate synthase [Pseudonocardia sp. Ae356_Ps1]